MAWKPNQQQLSAYEEILKRYNKFRKQITRVHRALEEVTPSGRMPSLVVPKRVRKMRTSQIMRMGRRAFLMKVRALKSAISGGLEGFYKDYKHAYMDLYSQYIIEEAPEGGTRWGAYYTKEQIENAEPKIAKVMHLYNSVRSMNAYMFAYGIKSGKFPEFKKLYNEVSKDFEFGESFASQFRKGIKQLKLMSINQAKRIMTTGSFGRVGKYQVGESSRNIARVGSKGVKTYRGKK